MSTRFFLVSVCVLVAVCCLLAVKASAQVPALIRYQGQAVDAQSKEPGVALEGPYDLTFRLYDAATEGKVVWEERHEDVVLRGGHFSVLLGSVKPLDRMSWDEPCWLSVQVNDQHELEPRQPITSVPLALTAERLADSHTISPVNLLKNGSFELWSVAPNGLFLPTDWNAQGFGTEALQQTVESRYGQTAVTLTNLVGANFHQHLVTTTEKADTWRGRTFTLSGWVKTTTADRVQLLLHDGVVTSRSAFHSGSGDWELLTTTFTVPPTALQFIAYFHIKPGDSSVTTTFDGAMLVEGPMPFAFSPHPADLLPPDISARVFNSAHLSIAHGSTTALTFNSERWDTDTMHSTSINTGRLTATTAGKYLISANIDWEASATGIRFTRIRLNGSAVIAQQSTLGNSHIDTQHLTTYYDLAANDYVEVVVSQTSGGPLNVGAESRYSPEFWMVKLD